MATGLSILKAGRKYLLGIPPTVGVKEFKIDRKLVKKYGTYIPIPFTFMNAFLDVKKGKVKLRRKKHYNTIFMSGEKLGEPDLIIAFSIPEDASYQVIDKRLNIVVPEHKKVSIVVLGDLTEPVDVPNLVNIVRA